jgi:hypothetical protein
MMLLRTYGWETRKLARQRRTWAGLAAAALYALASSMRSAMPSRCLPHTPRLGLRTVHLVDRIGLDSGVPAVGGIPATRS